MELRSDDELRQLAVDLFDQKVFCDRFIMNCTGTDLMMVFLPLALGAFEGMSEAEVEDINFFYEYYSEALPSSINGRPIFSSVNFLTKPETITMFKFYDEYRDMKTKFIKPSVKN